MACGMLVASSKQMRREIQTEMLRKQGGRRECTSESCASTDVTVLQASEV
jgi:galactitol-specific phosphotransferase system IIB component